MKAFASSFGAWDSIEKQVGTNRRHGLVFPLAVVEAIGAPHGLELVAEETQPPPPTTADYDAVFITVLDSRTMINTAKHFEAWGMPLRSADRPPGGRWPFVWAGGQGLYNPLPLGEIVDLVVCGDAEPSLPALLEAFDTHGHTTRFLETAAGVAGVYVPSVHGPTPAAVVRGVAADVDVTLRNVVKVNHGDMRRVEIARGCKFSCRFCSLGWNQPYRENTAADILSSVGESGESRVHLQAGDAESHSQIVEIRAGLADKTDTGWTGRYDSVLDSTTRANTHIEGWKRHAVGVEGMTWATRQLVGKGYLTDAVLIDDTTRYLGMLAPGTQGRLVWHMMAGLPGEQFADAQHFGEVLQRVGYQMGGQERRNLGVHWQPFQPVPGTPMQWFAHGTGARRLATFFGSVRVGNVNVYHQAGRSDRYAGLCTVLARSDGAGGRALLEAYTAGGLSVSDAETVGGVTAGVLAGDETPWDFVVSPEDRGRLLRSRDAMRATLGAER